MDGIGDPLARRRILALIAGIQRDRGEYDAAQATYHEALDLYAKAKDERGEGRAQAGHAGDVDKPTALQRAMKALRSRARFGSPRFWAPFVLVGAED